MKTHELKTLEVYFDAVVRGDKTFEIRKNDRDFQTGDVLVLREWDPGFRPEPATPPAIAPYPAPPQPVVPPRAPGFYTGRLAEVRVTYVLHDTYEKFGLQRGYVVLGLDGNITMNAPEDFA